MRILFIHGLAAVGKLTVAKELMKLLLGGETQEKKWRLFHNHLVVDLVASLFDFGTPNFVAARETCWLTLFERAMNDPTIEGLVFTFCFETTADEFPPKLLDLVKKHEPSTSIHFIELVCDCDEMLQRVTSESRRGHKLADRDLYQKLLEQNCIYSSSSPSSTSPVVLTNELVLDTTNTPPNETALKIHNHFFPPNSS
eukprot:TRINITY_DN5432_c0_g1_i1.p1 TRINITY_DN5432_c0_g1~~TRINITY_DN5432_c0_g1_i1.p1  ORF type:complete len:198 (-),score=53.72 TRINITY_DN5432_c0_g1_i1:166-759(-)